MSRTPGTAVDRDGWALACKTCAYRFPLNITQGVGKAHFETEHDTDDVQFELVVVCRCDRTMTFTARVNGRDVFDCPTCHRTRRIVRTEP